MSIARLKDRVPSATRLGCYSLREHNLRFHKSSKDGSGKCDAYYTGNSDDCVIGALFEIDPNEKSVLDKAESLGCGYEEKTVRILGLNNDEIEAKTYYATKIDKSLKPYSWYLNHVLVGAKETHLPQEYIEKIEATESTQDLDKGRDAKQRAMYS